MSLQDRAMLVNLTISKWEGTKFDPIVSAEVEQKHGAHDAGRYNKRLIDKHHFKAINQTAAAVRDMHYRFTLPWTDKGYRLLPAEMFFDYQTEYQKYQAEFSRDVSAFLASYPALVTQAQSRLGTMFDPADYPDPQDLKSAFKLGLDYMPMPDAADFRVSLDEQTVSDLKAQITKSVNEKQADAVKDCWLRAKELIQRVARQCGNEKGRIYDSLMENLNVLVSMLSKLNVTNDLDLIALEKEVRQFLIVPTEQLRTSPTTRKAVADKADEILKRMPF